MSRYALDDLIEAGVTDIAIVIGDPFPNKVSEFYGDGKKFGVNVQYIYQKEPRGIAQAIGLCRTFVDDEKFVVYLGDNILKRGIRDYVKQFNRANADALILLSEVKNPSRFGIATLSGSHIKKIVEKPENPDSNLAVIGVYFLSSNIFSIISSLRPSWRGELEITDALQNLMSSGGKVEYDFITGWWKDIGTPEDILDANRFMLDSIQREIGGILESEESVKGHVSIGKNTKIPRNVLVRGPVVIGENCIFESGVIIGPYTSIGNSVKIQQGEIENSIVMDNCEIGTNSRIVDSIIAKSSKIVELGNSLPKRHTFFVGEQSLIRL